jgi:hypothetical protein
LAAGTHHCSTDHVVGAGELPLVPAPPDPQGHQAQGQHGDNDIDAEEESDPGLRHLARGINAAGGGRMKAKEREGASPWSLRGF